MDERIQFIEHKGKQILLLDFSLATAPQMIPLLMQVKRTVAQHGPESVLVLANYEGAEIDHKVAMKIKEVLALDPPFREESGVAGHGAHSLPFSESFQIFSQRETATFKTQKEALEWSGAWNRICYYSALPEYCFQTQITLGPNCCQRWYLRGSGAVAGNSVAQSNAARRTLGKKLCHACVSALTRV